MNMVWHNHKFMQRDVRKMLWNRYPTLVRDQPELTWSEAGVHNMT
jgi:hypothetical protein